MSEKTKISGVWFWIFVLVINLATAIYVNFQQLDNIRDLQRRVGQLESERR